MRIQFRQWITMTMILFTCVLFSFQAYAFQNSLEELLNQEKVLAARKMYMGMAPPKKDLPCYRCLYYRLLLRHGRWLTPDEILEAQKQVLFAHFALKSAR